jgi:hypothetical protein
MFDEIWGLDPPLDLYTVRFLSVPLLADAAALSRHTRAEIAL